jgi:hypothetical protein
MEREKGSRNHQVQVTRKKEVTGDRDGKDDYDDEDVQSLHCNKYLSEDK